MSRPACMRHGVIWSVALAAVTLLTLALVSSPAAPAAAAADADSGDGGSAAKIAFNRWQGAADWRAGDAEGLTVLPGQLTGIMMTGAAGTAEHTDPEGDTAKWEYARWTSPLTDLPFGATELVASWSASTPRGSWLSVQMQGTYDDGSTTPWYVMGQWSTNDDTIARASIDGQADEHSRVLTDTLAVTTPGKPSDAGPPASREGGVLLSGYRLRVTLYRQPGSLVTPRVWMLGAMASNVPDRLTVEPSKGGIAWGEELAVPRRSKNVHLGWHLEYGGGAAWSSPAAVSMVTEYFGQVPSHEDMAWIDPGYTDPQVAHAARRSWDHTFEGAGNWSFNVAYASSFAELDAFVTRLRSLDDVERFIRAGIPVITSMSFLESELNGAGYSTSGDLMVVTGFTDDGDVIVNDPGARSNASVRRIYDRAQFEQIWLRTQRRLADGTVASGSAGIVYIIAPYRLDLPNAESDAW